MYFTYNKSQKSCLLVETNVCDAYCIILTETYFIYKDAYKMFKFVLSFPGLP